MRAQRPAQVTRAQQPAQVTRPRAAITRPRDAVAMELAPDCGDCTEDAGMLLEAETRSEASESEGHGMALEEDTWIAPDTLIDPDTCSESERIPSHGHGPVATDGVVPRIGLRQSRHGRCRTRPRATWPWAAR